MKIGLISYGSPVLRYDIAQKYLEQTVLWLKKSKNQIVSMEKVVLTEAENRKAMALFEQERPALLVIQMGTFTQGNMLMDFIMEFEDIPVFVWGFKDPIIEDFPTIPLNSLTGMTMLTSFLHKVGKKFSYGYGDFEDMEIRKKLSHTIQAVETMEKLKHSRYAIVGSRAPGFYRCMVDELQFRKQIGPELVYHSLVSLLRDAEKIPEAKVRSVREKINPDIQINIGKTMVERTIRLELAMQEFIRQEGIDAVTMKCWPELQDMYQCSGCGVLSWLNDSGITACCEGDVAGLATMDILTKIGKKQVFFADLVSAAGKSGIKAWHCGFGPERLAREHTAIEYTEQATMRSGIGIGVQYEMKLGRISMCKLSEQGQGYHMFYAGGNTVEPDRKLLGVQTDIMLDAGMEKVIETIVNHGFEQHYAIIHSDIRQQLEEFAKWTGIHMVCAE